MSTTLVWAPAERATRELPFQLKTVLQDRFKFPEIFRYSDLPYFRGLRDAGIEGADEVIEALEKYEEIEIDLL